jgi:hypothetical protein
MFETTTRETAIARAECYGKIFTPWKTGGKAQVFCRPGLPPRLGSCGRRFVTQALTDGRLTSPIFGMGVPVTRALVWRGAVVEGAVQIEVLPGRRA